MCIRDRTKDGKKSSSALKIKKRGMVYPTFTMMKGEKLPILFSNKESSVSWTSADETIATVDADGVVTVSYTHLHREIHLKRQRMGSEK